MIRNDDTIHCSPLSKSWGEGCLQRCLTTSPPLFVTVNAVSAVVKLFKHFFYD